MQDQLGAVRLRLQAICNDPLGQERTNDLFTRRFTEVPSELKPTIGKDVSTSLMAMDDATLLHFLSWHQVSLTPAQEGFKAMAQDYAPAIFTDLEDMADNGQLPLTSLNALTGAQQRTKAYQLLDSFESGQRFADALYFNETMYVGEHLVEDPAMTYNKIFHESLHGCEVVCGMPFDVMATPDSGSISWLSDAFIEHVTQTACFNVEWEDPANITAQDDETYVLNRQIFGALLKGGRKEVPLTLFANAFFDIAPDFEPRRALQTAINESYRGFLKNGNNLVAEIAQDYNNAPTVSDRQEAMLAWRTRLSA
jgi:hypothetical protein